MAMTITTIGSSSAGNCYVMQNDGEALIIEAGTDLLKVKEALGWNITKVRGVIITHQHNDHAKHAADFARMGLPVLCLPEVISAKKLGRYGNVMPIEPGKGKIMGGFKVLPFPVMHDVPCVGYIIDHQESGRTLFLTDTYAYARQVTTDRGKEKVVPYNFSHVNHWMIEANYSDHILDNNIERGLLHDHMRRRLMISHMEIGNTVRVLKNADRESMRDILLIHLSDGNSNEKNFIERVRKATGKRAHVARPGLMVDISLNRFQ